MKLFKDLRALAEESSAKNIDELSHTHANKC